MKISYYNFYKTDGDGCIIYNSRTGNMARLDKEHYDKLNEFIINHKAIDDEQYEINLRRGGFIIADDIDESKLIEYYAQKVKHATEILNLVIAPTADCNLRCKYCYEKEQLAISYMDKDVEDAIIRLLESKIDGLQTLNLTWYGGEPLLALDTIRDLSRLIIKMCDNNGVVYEPGIITNGYLLTPERLQVLYDLNIYNIQITLDGGRDIHNARRPYKDGTGTYDVIMTNLKNCKDIIREGMVLRINTDKINIDSVDDVRRRISELQLEDRIHIYMARVNTTNDCYDNNKCFTCGEFSKLELGFDKNDYKSKKVLSNKYPKPKAVNCIAEIENSMVIGPDGEVYKCYADIGIKKYSIGNVKTGQKTINKRFLDFMMYNPTSSEKCRKCKFMPICMSGCASERIAGKETCTRYKYILDDFIDIWIGLKEEEKRNAKESI